MIKALLIGIGFGFKSRGKSRRRMRSMTPYWELGSDQPYYDVCEEIHKLRTYTGLDEYERMEASDHDS